mgnify:FL=1
MNDNKKPSEPVEIKELLTHQLQLVSKESEEAHGETLAALSFAAADLAQAVAACSRLTCVFPRGSESAPKAHMLTIDEMPRHTFGCSEFEKSGAHTNSVGVGIPNPGAKWAASPEQKETTHYHTMDESGYTPLVEIEAKLAYDHAVRMREQGEFERLAAEQDTRTEEKS